MQVTTKRALFLAVLAMSAVVFPSSANAQQLPKVWINGTNPAPCYNSVEVHGKFVDHKIACYASHQ